MCNKSLDTFFSLFLCYFPLPPSPLTPPPFFFSCLFFLQNSGSDAGYWAFENLILDLPWDSDLVILRPGFPAENGDNNAFFILLPASFVSLDTEALGRGITFYNIQVFRPNIWEGLKEIETWGISMMKRGTQMVVETAILVFNQ